MILHLIRDIIAEHPDDDADTIAELVYQRTTKAALKPLIVVAVEHEQRQRTRRMERSVTIRRLGPLLAKAQKSGGELIPSDDDRERILDLMRRTWRLGDGSLVEIGAATLPEIDRRLMLLYRHRDGVNESIGILEQVKAELVRTGASCLNDLIGGAA